MENKVSQEVVTSATDATDQTNEYDELVRHWLHLCAVGVASTATATSTWLQLSCDAIALYSSQIHSTPDDHECTHKAVIHKISQSDQQCRDALVAVIKGKVIVKSYSRGSIEEQVITFHLILGHNFKNRVVSFFSCRSGETVSRYFHNILVSIITLEEDYLKAANAEEVQPIILNSHRFFPYFKDCLGAIDDTHVRVKVSQVDAPRYRGRKDWHTQNVLASCTFDLKFTYLLVGWEGPASDSRVLQSALTRTEPLVIPTGKYYLGNAGFGLTGKLLTQYGRTRYHLKEYSQSGPETPEEIFNHRHSSLRNCIKRAFGVLKKQFHIIASGSECRYSVSTTTNIILACDVFHNFILSIESEVDTVHQEGSDAFEDIFTANQDLNDVNNSNNVGDEYTRGQTIRARIASDMWSEYCNQNGASRRE